MSSRDLLLGHARDLLRRRQMDHAEFEKVMHETDPALHVPVGQAALERLELIESRSTSVAPSISEGRRMRDNPADTVAAASELHRQNVMLQAELGRLRETQAHASHWRGDIVASPDTLDALDEKRLLREVDALTITQRQSRQASKKDNVSRSPSTLMRRLISRLADAESSTAASSQNEPPMRQASTVEERAILPPRQRSLQQEPRARAAVPPPPTPSKTQYSLGAYSRAALRTLSSEKHASRHDSTLPRVANVPPSSSSPMMRRTPLRVAASRVLDGHGPPQTAVEALYAASPAGSRSNRSPPRLPSSPPTSQLARRIASLDAMHLRDCVDLAVVWNHPLVIDQAVVPLLLADLRQHASLPQHAARTRGALCTLIGLGNLAAGAYDCLFQSLLTGAMDKKLVALAIRRVGGERALDDLLQLLAGPSVSPSVAIAAAYAIGLDWGDGCVGSERTGRTVCATFHFPGHIASDSPGDIRFLDMGVRAEGARASRKYLTITPQAPNFTEHHFVFDFHSAQQRLVHIMTSTAPPVEVSSRYPDAAWVENALADCVERLAQQGSRSVAELPPCVPADLVSLRRHAGSSPVAALRGPIRIPAGLVSTLLRRLSQVNVHATLLQQLLLTYADLPVNVTASSLHEVIRIACDRAESWPPSVIAVACETLAWVAGAAASYQDAAVSLLQHGLGHPSSQVANAAAAGLRNLRKLAVSLRGPLCQAWQVDGRVEGELAVGALLAMGSAGTESLLRVLTSARNGGRCDHVAVVASTLSQDSMTALSDTDRERLSAALLDLVLTQPSDLGDDALIPAVAAIGTLSLAPLAAPLASALVDHDGVETTPMLSELINLFDDARFSVRFKGELAKKLANSGGAAAHTELLKLLFQDPDPVVRAAVASALAPFVLLHLHPLTLAILDADDTVVAAALSSLASCKFESLVQALQTTHSRLVGKIAVNCEEFLVQRSHELVQAVYDFLQVARLATAT